MDTFRLPTVYSVLFVGELPAAYEVECNWCHINKVTPKNRCWVPVPQKNVVHQTCATGERRLSKAGFFHCWECAMSFCYWWRGMDRYMDQVRIEAGKQGYLGRILIQAPNPLLTLSRFHPGVKGTRQETEDRYNQYLKDGEQVREVRYSEISSARIHRLYRGAEREAAHVLEHSSPDAPDLRPAIASIEKVAEGDVATRDGAYVEYLTAHTRAPKPSEPPADRATSSRRPAKRSSAQPSAPASGSRQVTFRPLF